MKKRQFACGRTKEDGELCCTRKHRWWNTKKVRENNTWNIYCRVCGHMIVMSSCKHRKDVNIW